MTVPSGRQPESCLFMKPGSVSVRFFQTCFPQTSSNQVDPVASPEGSAVGSGCSWSPPLRAAPFLHPLISHTFQRSILSDLTLKRWSTRLSSGEVVLLPVSPRLIFQRRNLTVQFFSRPGPLCSCRGKISLDFLTWERSLLRMGTSRKEKLPFRYL
jgi:hypothetical protein